MTAREPIRVGLIGLGAIGRAVAGSLPAAFELVSVLVRPEREAEAATALGADVAVVTDVGALLAQRPRVVVECAGQAAVAELGEAVIAHGADLLIVSTGALVDDDLRRGLEVAAEVGGRLVIAPGAIAALDGLAALRIGGLERVRYTSSKPPHAWIGTAADGAFDLAAITEPTQIFSGSAREAARRYPKNANVAATVALAGIGLDRTQVVLVADPSATDNVGVVEAEGRLGTLVCRLDGPAMDTNPRTSAVTATSLVHVLERTYGRLVL